SEHAAELAMHFERGRDAARAVRYLQQAAANALQRFAYQEAMAHLTRALAVLQTLPDTTERAREELELQLTLGEVLTHTIGAAACGVRDPYARAQALSQQTAEEPHRLAVLRGLRRFHLARGELQAGLGRAEEFLRLAEQRQDPILLVEAHVALGVCVFNLGNA